MNMPDQSIDWAGEDISLERFLGVVESYFRENITLQLDLLVEETDWSKFTKRDGRGAPRFPFLDDTNKILVLLRKLFDARKIQDPRVRISLEEHLSSISGDIQEARSIYSSLNMCLQHRSDYSGVLEYLEQLAGALRQVISKFSEIEEIPEIKNVPQVKEILNLEETRKVLKLMRN